LRNQIVAYICNQSVSQSDASGEELRLIVGTVITN